MTDEQAGLRALAPGAARPRGAAHSVLLEWVEQQLLDGELSVGDKLPAERALADQFGISRASVREGIRVLDALGLVSSEVGSGPRAGATVISEPSRALAWALRMHVATQALPMSDIVDMRVLLETQSMQHADASVPEAREEICGRARRILQRMDEDVSDELFHALDAEFHVTLGELSGSVVTVTMLASLRSAVIGYVTEGVAQVNDWPALRQRLQAQHWAILDAATRGDPQKAADLLKKHILHFQAAVAPGPRTGSAE